MKFAIVGAQEVLRMSGPYVGTLLKDGNTVSNNCVADNFVFYESKRLLFFVKYHVVNYYKYFTINFYKVDDDAVFEFEREFDMLYLGEFVDAAELEIYRAFHDKFSSNKEIFNIDKEEFTLI